jgi:hypothetical protein
MMFSNVVTFLSTFIMTISWLWVRDVDSGRFHCIQLFISVDAISIKSDYVNFRFHIILAHQPSFIIQLLNICKIKYIIFQICRCGNKDYPNLYLPLSTCIYYVHLYYGLGRGSNKPIQQKYYLYLIYLHCIFLIDESMMSRKVM